MTREAVNRGDALVVHRMVVLTDTQRRRVWGKLQLSLGMEVWVGVQMTQVLEIATYRGAAVTKFNHLANVVLFCFEIPRRDTSEARYQRGGSWISNFSKQAERGTSRRSILRSPVQGDLDAEAAILGYGSR